MSDFWPNNYAAGAPELGVDRTPTGKVAAPTVGALRTTEDALRWALMRIANSNLSQDDHYAKAIELLVAAPVAQPAQREQQLIDALHKLRIRMHFIGWPAESYWNVGPEDAPRWVPDWRYEAQLLEHVLFGSEIMTPEKPTDTIPFNQLPQQPTVSAPSGGLAEPIRGWLNGWSQDHCRAAYDALHVVGFHRDEDWFVCTDGQAEQLHIDTIAAIGSAVLGVALLSEASPTGQAVADDSEREAEDELNCAEETLEALHVKYDLDIPTGYECIGDYITAVVEALAARSSPQAQPQPEAAPVPAVVGALLRWVNVAERLPEDGQEVIAIIHQWNDPTKPRCLIWACLEHGVWLERAPEEGSFGDAEIYPPTHWAPIPDLPPLPRGIGEKGARHG